MTPEECLALLRLIAQLAQNIQAATPPAAQPEPAGGTNHREPAVVGDTDR